MIAVIQLDGLGAEPLRRLLDAGEMPNLAAFLTLHRPVELDTPAPLFPAAVYPTLYSGLDPVSHGLFYPFQWSPERQRVTVADAHPRPPMLWQRLGALGLRSLVIDPYEAIPAPAPRARVVSGWQLAERVVARRWSRPRSLWPSAALRLGPPPPVSEVFGATTDRDRELLARRLRGSPGRVAELLHRELAGPRRPDLVWASLIAPHLGGHRLWGTDHLDDVYRATDQALGQILDELPGGAETIVLCPIGMEADEAAADLLPEMLARVLGEAEPSAGSEKRDRGLWSLRAAVPAGLRGAIPRAMPARLARALTARLELRGTEWSRTRAFAHPSDNQGLVRLNLRGREREGIVDPAEADSLCAGIAAGLESFRRRTGETAIESVERVWQGGGRGGLLPDLVVRWSRRGEPLDAVRSERFGVVERRGAGSGRSGNHPDDGAWIAGAGISPPPGRPAALSDVAATILARAGTGAAGLDGVPLEGDRAASRPAPAVLAPDRPTSRAA